MFCKKCGTQIIDNAKFCAGCGTAVASAPPSPTPVQSYDQAPGQVAAAKRNYKTLLLILIPLVVIIIGVAIALVFFTRNVGNRSGGVNRNEITVTDSISFFAEDDRVIVAVNNEEIFIVNGELHEWRTQSSKDGSAAIIMTDFDWPSGGTLWFVTKAGATRIADDVDYAMISSSGNGVIYSTFLYERDNSATLYLYDTVSGNHRRITNDAYSDILTISPDGRSVGYIVMESSWDPLSFAGYIVIDNGEPESLGENRFPFAIADNGKYVYYAHFRDDFSFSFYVRSVDDDVRLSRDADDIDILFNHDLSQAIFRIDDRSFISINGGEAERLGNITVGGVVGTNLAYHRHRGWDITVFGIDSFANQVIQVWDNNWNGNVMYIDDEFQVNRIPGTSGADVFNPQLVDNGSSVIFLDLDTRRMSRVAIGDEHAEEERLARNVARFLVSTDGRIIYFRDEDGDLWAIDAQEETTRLAHDVHPWALAMLPGSNKIFFIEDFVENAGGILSFSDNGESRERIRGINDAVEVWSTATSIFYRNIDGDVFRSNGDANFERVLDGVMARSGNVWPQPDRRGVDDPDPPPAAEEPAEEPPAESDGWHPDADWDD